MTTMTDLFCGAGIGAVGFQKAGFDIIYAIDNNKHAVDTYNANIGNHAVLKDIHKVSRDEIPYADVITGGVPCKPYSVAGKGEGTTDKRYGDLIYEFMKIIENKKPKAFIFENVKGLISKRHKDTFDEFLQFFVDIGYNITWKLTNCLEYGMAQKRERVFVVGMLDDTFVFPEPTNDQQTIRDVIGDLPMAYEYGTEVADEIISNHYGYGIRNDEAPFVNQIPIGCNWKSLSLEDQKTFMKGAFNSGGGRTGFLRKVDLDKPSHTITSEMLGKNNAQIIDGVQLMNHYYSQEGYSSGYKSRNQQKQWEEESFCIVSSSRHLPLYPDPPNYDIRKMEEDERPTPRRFTVRECLRLQSVPDSFYFNDNVPIRKQYERCSGIPSMIAYLLGKKLKEQLENV